ncbi:MAG: MFS transporter [Ferruginibacter sp.]
MRAIINLYRNAYDGLDRNIWLLGFVMLINRSGTMVLAFLTLYCHHLGFTLQQGGYVVAIYGMGAVAGAFLGGKIADKYGFSYTQFLALFCGGVLFIVLGQMRTYGAICIVTFFLSLVNEAFRPANASAIAYYSTQKNRTQSFSLVRLAINLGWGIGSGIGGILASIDYHLLFWVDGGTNILAAGLLWMILPHVKNEKNATSASAMPGESLPIQLPHRDKTFLWFLLFNILFATCFFQLFTTVPTYFKEVLLLPEFIIGLVMASNGLMIAVFEMVLVFRLEGKKPYLLLMSYGAVLMALSFLLLNLHIFGGFFVALASTIVITLAEMIAMPFMNSFYIGRSNEKTRGQYAGMYTMAWSIAQVIGSSTGAIVAYQYGYRNLWILVALVALCSSVGYMTLLRKEKKLMLT